MVDLNNPSVREKLLDAHPIIKRKSLILTPMIEGAYLKIREKIWLRHSGLFLYAVPRMGKTKCLIAVRQMLAYEFPEKFSLTVEVDPSKSANFMKDLLRAAHCYHRSRDYYPDLLERYLIHIEGQLEAIKGEHFILFIDEMQNVTRDGYGILLTIHNRLERRGINMTTVGFAQTQILQRRTALFTVGDTNYIARFLSEPVAFPGCLNKESLKSVLKGFDAETEYPEGSGWSFTQFFLPVAFNSGFKLEMYVDIIWNGLSEIGKLNMSGLPMEYVFKVFEHLLLANRSNDDASFSITEEIVEDAVRASGIRELVEMMRNAP